LASQKSLQQLSAELVGYDGSGFGAANDCALRCKPDAIERPAADS
jgi:hypothetical protein